MVLYAILISLIAVIILRVLIMKKQRKVSDEKIHFFINTAHDIRTPLTLIKAPLEDLREKEALSKEGIANMNTALRNVNALLRLTTNLINFERADVYLSLIHILQKSKTGKWHSYLSTFENVQNSKNHIFTTLCEVSPGIIWAGGYFSGIYQIDKRTSKTTYFTPALYAREDIRPDKYIRDIRKDSHGYIWTGGYYNLKRINVCLLYTSRCV